jgi:hypothetical protein
MTSNVISEYRVFRYIHRLIYKLYIFIKVGFYRIMNRSKPKILIFTDSRGFDVEKKQNRFDPFDCYPGFLIKNYNVEYSICPEKHTTIMDFLDRYQDKLDNYDHIILHAGIVEFSPRHKSVSKKLIYEQKPCYDKVFGKDNMLKHLDGDLGVDYEGEKTINMYSFDMARNNLIPLLSKIDNLLWIGCNNFVEGWEGNYAKERPKNIRIVEEYSRLFTSLLPNCIDLSDWRDDEIKIYTCDNIHLTKSGHVELFNRIEKNISGKIKNKITT